MKALAYRNTKTVLPGWAEPLHKFQPLGYAYEHETHFIHFYGQDSGLWTISPGLTVSEKKNGDLCQWLEDHFGAVDLVEMNSEVGDVVEGVWRPGLYYQDQTLQALGGSETIRPAEQALRLLVERLDELLLYIEPSTEGLTSYGRKTRELLILACTEVENQCKQYITLAGYTNSAGRNLTTADYVKLAPKLYLHEFEIALAPYNGLDPFCPFREWAPSNPSKSIPWYDAYNKTKHDLTTHFASATLENCISAVAANVALFCTRFGPFFLLQGSGTLSSLVNQLFRIVLKACDARSFYVPRLVFPSNIRQDLMTLDSSKFFGPWDTVRFTV